MINQESMIKTALECVGYCTIFEIKRLFPGLDENDIAAFLTKLQLEGKVTTTERVCDVKKQSTIAYALSQEIIPPPVSPSLIERLDSLLKTLPELTGKVQEIENTNETLTQRLGVINCLVSDKINGLCASIILLKQEIPKLTDKIKELETQVVTLSKPRFKRKRRKPVVLMPSTDPDTTASIMLEAAKLFREASTQLKPTHFIQTETNDPNEALNQAMEALKEKEATDVI
jgi:hypothetical protein